MEKNEQLQFVEMKFPEDKEHTPAPFPACRDQWIIAPAAGCRKRWAVPLKMK